jgi:hypothetical protein
LHSAWKKRERLGLDLALIVLSAVALVHAIRATSGIYWPYDVDQNRDTGLAQTILDHRYGMDHIYLGETIWYNPLTSIIVATLSRATGTPPYLVTTRAGVYLNLLAPLAFYLLVAYLFDRWTALASTSAFLFGPIGDAPSWAAASYSPWLFGENLAQALFYLTLMAYCKALESKRQLWFIAVGVLLGVTFLGQTTPAAIFGAIVVIVCIRSAIQHREGGLVSIVSTQEIRGLGPIVAVAFLVSLPFTFSILGRYHLRILNSEPSNWMYPPLAASNLPAFLRDNLSCFSIIAGLGFLVLVTEPSVRHRKTLLLTWLAICCLELSLNFAQQVSSPTLHLMFVPAHHFLFYLMAIRDILFGVGLVFIGRVLARNLPSTLFGISLTTVKDNSLRRPIEAALVSVCVLCFLVLAFPSYRIRFDFTTARARSLEIQQNRRDLIDAYRWILSNTQPDDVFLSTGDEEDLRVVAPAARKLVFTYVPMFSNPYVDWESRAEAARLMAIQLISGSTNTLETLAKYKVKYVIASPELFRGREPYSTLFLSKQFAEGQIIIYRVRDAATQSQ